MRISVDHRTRYRFTKPHARIVQLLRMTPQDGIDQTVVQILVALSTIVISGVVTLVIALALKATLGWRIPEDVEVAGIDQAEHAESGYDLVARGGRVGAGSAPELSPDARHHDELTSEGAKA